MEELTSTKKFSRTLKAEMEKNCKLAVGYRRVSDEKQRTGGSLETQKQEIETYCFRQGLTLTKIYEDIAVSGTSTNGRVGLREMLSEIKPGMVLVLTEVSRLGRDNADNATIWKNLVDSKGCRIVFITEGIDSSENNSKTNFAIRTLFAADDSEKRAERVSRVMRRMAKDGVLMCRPPFGYKYRQEDRTFQREEEQMAVLDLMIELRLAGTSINKIANILNEAGHSRVLNNNKITRVEKPRFYASTVSGILKGYKINASDDEVKHSYHERVEKWNSVVHARRRYRSQEEDGEEVSPDESKENKLPYIPSPFMRPSSPRERTA